MATSPGPEPDDPGLDRPQPIDSMSKPSAAGIHRAYAEPIWGMVAS
jgi:hypothetical protein